MGDWVDWIIYEIPPGPPIIPMYYYVNGHKGTLPIVFFAMMIYYKNFSLGAWLYLALHGSYGMFWMLKDYTFPDKSFQRKVTIVGFLFPWPVALLPYLYSGYLMMSGQANQNPDPERIFVCVVSYVTGIVFMLGGDAQKYFMLRERPGLIHDGYNYWTRNPNYCGEILLYASFGILV